MLENVSQLNRGKGKKSLPYHNIMMKNSARMTKKNKIERGEEGNWKRKHSACGWRQAHNLQGEALSLKRDFAASSMSATWILQLLPVQGKGLFSGMHIKTTCKSDSG